MHKRGHKGNNKNQMAWVRRKSQVAGIARAWLRMRIPHDMNKKRAFSLGGSMKRSLSPTHRCSILWC